MPNQTLPEGWKIEGLWHGFAEGKPVFTEVNSRTVTDAAIEGADRIAVSYTSRKTGLTIYRTINGAESRKQIRDIIVHQTRVISPRKGSRR